jgi:peptide/nickel transport system substrate-binding protein
VEMVDQLTVRFLLPDIYAPFGEATTMPLLPAHLLKDVRVPDMTRHPFNQRPVGTGPFKFQGRDEQRIVLVSNPDFYRSRPYRERPYLDRIVLRFYPDSSSALQALARKEVQGYAGMLPTDAARARRLRNTAVYSMPSSEYSVLFFNLAPDRPVFLDRRVRQAIAMAINRPRLVELATEGQGAVAEQPVLPYSWAYAEDARRYEYSPAQAKAALDAAGWVDANGDGARERGQVTLRFTLLTSDDFTRVATADQIALDLAEVGIQATIEAIPFDELIEKRSRQRSYDAVLLSVASGSDPDPYPFWHSSQTKDPGTNFTGYATLAMDRALEGARRTLDQAKRRDLYAQVFAQIAEDVPAVYLYFSDFLYAVDRGLQGVRAAPITDPSQRFWNAEDWYVRTRIVE